MNLALHNVDDLFAALGDRIRLRLACCLLAVPTGACVCELVDALDESQPNVSRHLKVLKAARLWRSGARVAGCTTACASPTIPCSTASARALPLSVIVPTSRKTCAACARVSTCGETGSACSEPR